MDQAGQGRIDVNSGGLCGDCGPLAFTYVYTSRMGILFAGSDRAQDRKDSVELR